MTSNDHSRIETWEGLLALKRQALAEIVAGETPPLEIDEIRSETERLESLIAFYKTTLVDTAA